MDFARRVLCGRVSDVLEVKIGAEERVEDTSFIRCGRAVHMKQSEDAFQVSLLQPRNQNDNASRLQSDGRSTGDVVSRVHLTQRKKPIPPCRQLLPTS